MDFRDGEESRGRVMETKEHILYLDTSEETARLGIFLNNKLVQKEEWRAGRELSKTLGFKYQEFLKKTQIKGSDLGGICVFAGPGSFTGLRIGISFANGLAFSLGIPVYETLKRETLDLKKPLDIALPHYGSEPKITQPKDKK